MKKPILITCLFFLNIYSIFSQISGSSNLYIGESSSYCIHSIYGDNISWNVGPGLSIDGGVGGCINLKGTKAGTWSIHARIYNYNGYLIKNEFFAVSVTTHSNAPVINGPHSLFAGQIAEYSASSDERRHVTFSAPSLYFDIIESSYNRIKVRVKNKQGTTYIEAEAADQTGSFRNIKTIDIKVPTISGTDNTCTSGTFSVANIPSNSSITWSKYPTFLSLTSNGNTCTVSGNHNGEAWVEATIDNAASIRKYFVMGNPIPMSIRTFHETSSEGTVYGWCSNQSGNKIRLEFGSSNTYLYWPLSYDVRLVRSNTNTVVANLGTIYGESDMDVNYMPSPSPNNWYEIQVRPTSCGTGSWHSIQEADFSDCSLSHYSIYSIYPNPGENYISLSRTSKDKEINRSLKSSLNIKISSATTGKIQKDINLGSIDEKIDISSLPSGLYIVSIIENNVLIESLKLIVK